jgi:hypothetical protein
MGQSSHKVEIEKTVLLVLVDGLQVEEKGVQQQTQNSCQPCPIYVISYLIKLLLDLKQI